MQQLKDLCVGRAKGLLSVRLGRYGVKRGQAGRLAITAGQDNGICTR